ELQEDLERQLSHLPLRHAPDRSVRERLAKWARRHPRLTSPSTLVPMLFVLLAGVAALWAWRAYPEQWKRAVEAPEEPAELPARENLKAFREAVGRLRGCDGEIKAVRALFDAGPLAQEQPDEDLARCRKALAPYRVVEDPKWQDRPDADELPKEDVGEVLY